jgi:outer membrane lipoprotein carrier protein
VGGGLAAAALLAIAVPLPAKAQGQDAGAILDQAVAAYGQVTTLRADFTQLVRDPMIGTDETTRGEFLQQRPNKFAMRWRQPRGDLIMSDGEYLWVYLPSTAPQQVVRQSLTGRGGGGRPGASRAGAGADLVAEFLERPRERFEVAYERAEAVGERPADVLALTPRDRNAPYQRVLLWLDRGDRLPRRVEISEGSGATRRITLERIRVNQPIPPSSFVFRPPAGVRVVDATL